MSGERKWERIKSEIARIAKWQSEERKRTITDLSRAIEELVSRRKKPEELEGIIAEAKTLAQQWKDPHSAKHPKERLPLFDGTSADSTFLLVALVVALRRDHELVEKIRRHFPEEVGKLSGASYRADAVARASTEPKLLPKRKHEQTRRKWHRSFFNSIEYQFGGDGEAEWRKSLQSHLGLPYQPSCLDDIFAGQDVNMKRLEDLFFGIGRKRLAKLVDHEDKNRAKYGSRAVGEIMKVLLKEKPRKRRKRRAPGRPRQGPWLNDADLRTRVFCAIEKRIVSIGKELLLSIDQDKATDWDKALRWWKEIAEPFLAIVCRHRPQARPGGC